MPLRSGHGNGYFSYENIQVSADTNEKILANGGENIPQALFRAAGCLACKAYRYRLCRRNMFYTSFMKSDTVNAISTLLTINSDRHLGYSKAAEMTRDAELKALFDYLSGQSKEFNQELVECVKKTEPGLQLSRANTSQQFVHFNDMTESDRQRLLSSCEFREESVKRSYDDLMEHTENLDGALYEVMSRQRTAIHRSHCTVRSLYFTF
jgi:uncharacterized protein (TIGR02284 family)